MKFRIGYDMNMDSFSLLLLETDFDGRTTHVVRAALTKEEYKQYEIVEPTIRLRRREAQNLMEELWAVGLRPAEGRYPQSELNALKNHLEDMRTLVFNK